MTALDGEDGRSADSWQPVQLDTNYQHHMRSYADLGRWYLEPQNIESAAGGSKENRIFDLEERLAVGSQTN